MSALPLPVRLPAPQWFAVHRIDSKAIVRIDGEIGLTGATAGELLAVIGDAAEVYITINSIGGDSNAGIEIHDGLAGRNVSVEIIGHCYSAATTIALAGSQIKMRRDALLMIHKAQLFVFGSAEVLDCGARRLRRLNTRLHRLIALRTGQPAAVVADWLSRDSYFSADEALAAGLVHVITEVGPAPQTGAEAESASMPGQTEDEALFYSLLRAMGPINVRCKAEFSRAVNAWLVQAVTGASPGALAGGLLPPGQGIRGSLD